MDRIKSFLVALGVNMAFRYKYLFLIALCIALHYACGISLLWAAGALLLWIIHGAVVTVMITFVANCNNVPRNQKGISLHAGRTAQFDELYRGEGSAGGYEEAHRDADPAEAFEEEQNGASAPETFEEITPDRGREDGDET